MLLNAFLKKPQYTEINTSKVRVLQITRLNDRIVRLTIQLSLEHLRGKAHIRIAKNDKHIEITGSLDDSPVSKQLAESILDLIPRDYLLTVSGLLNGGEQETSPSFRRILGSELTA